ncbi:MAG: DUF3046 domain-containing protein [Dermabacter sp.]|nr:DUF3046 domain-containing protein [Dermabacter sp.]
MRRSEFRERAEAAFGPELARTYARELSLVPFGLLSADEAIEQGFPVKDVWHTLCDEMNVPEELRWEVPPQMRRVRRPGAGSGFE